MKFLTAKEAGKYLQIDGRTMTRWARQGYIPAYPIGEGSRRLWRFLEAELDHWLLSKRTAREPATENTEPPMPRLVNRAAKE